MPPFSFTTIRYDDPPHSQRALDVFLPDAPSRKPPVHFVHGGEWNAGMAAKGREVRHHVHANAEHGFFYDIKHPCQMCTDADQQAFLKHLE